MTHTTAPNHLNLAAQLPAGAYHYLMHTLRETLPDLLTNSPEDIALRDQSAMARVAALCPANIAEAEVAALHVVHAEHAKACLRDSKNPTIALLGALKCRAQAASMARQANGSLRMLLRMQAARQKTESNPEARDRAAWTEHCALNLMAQALSPPPAPATPAHLSRSAGEVATLSGAGGGPGGEAKESLSVTESTQPECAPVRQARPALAATSQTGVPIRPLQRFARLPDDDLIKALLTALKPATVAKYDQFAEAAEA